MRLSASYENPREAVRQKLLRNDGQSFVGNSRQLIVDAQGENCVAKALSRDEESVIVFDVSKDGQVVHYPHALLLTQRSAAHSWSSASLRESSRPSLPSRPVAL